MQHREGVDSGLKQEGEVVPCKLHHAHVEILAPPLQLLDRLRLWVDRRLCPAFTGGTGALYHREAQDTLPAVPHAIALPVCCMHQRASADGLG